MRDFFKYFKNFDDIIAFVKFITQTTDTTSAKKIRPQFYKNMLRIWPPHQRHYQRIYFPVPKGWLPRICNKQDV